MVIVRLVYDAGATEVTPSRPGMTSRRLDWSVRDSITVNRSVHIFFLILNLPLSYLIIILCIFLYIFCCCF